MFKLPYSCAHFTQQQGMLKILQARLQQYVNQELPDVQVGFRRGRGNREQIPSIYCTIEKTRESQKNIYFCFTDSAKAFDCGGGGLVARLCPTLTTPWTVTHQVPQSMGFSRQGYRSGLPFPSPGSLPDPGIKPGSPALQADSLPTKLLDHNKLWEILKEMGILGHLTCHLRNLYAGQEATVRTTELVANWERSMSWLCTVTLII